ncbi:hypothetical protein [Antribacter gilvus]|uniref:hypothetical protein n=1 Tax=Antribacter gilvus TaxID=2304675 RepID=UPI000F79922B|nr:hypothetical protein [Antribacter gilvus]
MAITRRTAVFAQLAASLESCLDIEGYAAEPGEVDRVLNTFLEVRAAEMRIQPRSMLTYFASPEIALSIAQNLATWFAAGPPSEQDAQRMGRLAGAVQQMIDDTDRPNS